MQIIGDQLAALKVPMRVTRRGVLRATLDGEVEGSSRAIVVHADTIGCMVKRLKENGRPEVVPIGTPSARFSEGAHGPGFVDDLTRLPTGPHLPRHSTGPHVDTTRQH